MMHISIWRQSLGVEIAVFYMHVFGNYMVCIYNFWWLFERNALFSIVFILIHSDIALCLDIKAFISNAKVKSLTIQH